MKYYLLFQMLVLLSLSNTACTQNADNYSGSFTNNELGLSLDVKKTGEKFTGFFEFQKKRYAFNGQNRSGVLQAEYVYEGKKVPFSLSLDQGVYYLNSEGFNIEMNRTSTGPASTAVKNKSEEGTDNTKHAIVNGQRVNDPYGSYSFTIPTGWVAKEEGGSFTITKEGDKVVYTIVPHNFREEETLTGLEDVIDESTGTDLRITKKENVAGGILVHFDGTSNGKAVIVKILSSISPYGDGGISFISSGLPVNYSEKHTDQLKVMASSVRFSKTKISSATRQWISKIKGRQLLYLNTSGGGSTRITLNLYENGQFDFSNNSSYLSGGSSVLSYAGKDSNSGTWKILSRNNQTVLVLYGGNRSAIEYILTERPDQGEINLNDRRYFIKTMN
jgi:hypothetical protein